MGSIMHSVHVAQGWGMSCSQTKSSATCTRQGSHDSDEFVDRRTIVRTGTRIHPYQSAITADDCIAAELPSVGVSRSPLESMPCSQQLDVLLRSLPTPDPPYRTAAEIERPVGEPSLVADDRERVGETVAVASEDPRSGERDDHDFGVAELISSITHGVDMCLARDSSQMSVQDQHQGPSCYVTGSPRITGVIDQLEVGNRVADNDAVARGSGAHVVLEPTISPVTSHDRPFGRYLEDFEPGDIYKHWPGKTITEADDHLFCMITMNHHPLHTNQWFAENETVHGKNVVVGNLVYSLVLGMSVADVSGAAIANLEIETLRHSKPTFHGDTIYAETRVLSKRESSKGDRGIVEVETKGLNQRGEEVCYFKRKVLVWKQENAPKRQRPYDESIWSED